MKCEGGTDPPCIRCCKARRVCLPQNLQQRNIESGAGPFVGNHCVSMNENPPLKDSMPLPKWYSTASPSRTQRDGYREDGATNHSGAYTAQVSRSATSPLASIESRSSLSITSTLPSIYSSPPTTVVSSSQMNTENDSEVTPSLVSKSVTPSQTNAQSLLIPLGDIQDMIELYVS